MKTNRREYLVASTLAIAAGLASAAGKAKENRPNILWIITDQQVADGMSCTGNPNLNTPAMDSLAANGVRFERAYCANPICVPSRTSMMTGRMPHETGVTLNMDLFKVLHPSLGSFITKAGYDTGYIGKWHIPMPTDTSDWHGFNRMQEGSKEFNDQHFAAPSIEFIKKKRNKPFFLVASFVNPHDICEWARRATGGFPERRTLLWNGSISDTPPPEECPALPANFQIPENEPDIIREYQTWQEGTYPVRDWPDERWRQYRWALNRLTERVDSEIAKVLDAVNDNTVIIFTSDHGDGNGAHKWNQKTLLYDEPARVPLIISGKGIAKPGTVDKDRLVSTGLDIFPTICDYAKAAGPDGLRGLSLRPLAEGKPVEWRDQLVVENDLSPAYGHSAGVVGRMLRTKNYKYVAYSTGKLRESLTDMRTDPGEMNNLAVDPAYREILQDHRNRLVAELKITNDSFIVPGTVSNGWKLAPC
ncbi:sulfatase family protein [Pontiella sulfatireligans]|uniref:Arylsulfatase n=1 Tax=Pontiella sulfatireligans TaxID=2750658 RepID=A0A6C2UST9_9BACT|nr:sulfatase-like hydrolase/transferase [Pontiella sulfatireligans]SPS74497.1 sulfatase S1_9 [Kiritimatiellales bacterium]VGO22321.1 Arylsulfatase [Pontiella sulfatireligans]